jgi:hypothetical protein
MALFDDVVYQGVLLQVGTRGNTNVKKYVDASFVVAWIYGEPYMCPVGAGPANTKEDFSLALNQPPGLTDMGFFAPEQILLDGDHVMGGQTNDWMGLHAFGYI